MIREGDPVYDLAIENPLRLWLNVPERYAAAIKVGQAVRVAVGSYPDEVFPATVTRINPTVATDSRSFQVEASVPNDAQQAPARRLRQGRDRHRPRRHVDDRPARRDRPLRRRDQAVHRRPDNKAHAVAVETGREGPGWVEVLTPLPADARVVTTGQSRLADGTAGDVRTRTAARPRRTRTPAPPGLAEGGLTR